MPHRSFVFRFDPSTTAAAARAGVEPSALGFLREHDEKDELQRRFYRRHGLTKDGASWAELPLHDNDAAISALIADTRAVMAAGDGEIGDGVLYEELTSEEEAETEWFRIWPRSTEANDPETDSFSRYHQAGYPTCKAWEVAPGVHIVEGPYVSGRFRRVVEDRGLRGLEFLWADDTGKWRPRHQWYCVFATHLLGHGLDHETGEAIRDFTGVADFLDFVLFETGG